jgi:hypothetical protein
MHGPTIYEKLLAWIIRWHVAAKLLGLTLCNLLLF